MAERVVLATAGHAGHGKTTLVRRLTGTDPDRGSAEKRDALTLGLGFARACLPSGHSVSVVDVPGDAEMLGAAIAGLGPAGVALFVVAADEGWAAQSAEHLAVCHALGISRGLLVITKTDLAPPDAALGQARAALEGTLLAGVESVAVSALTGAGWDGLLAALDRLVDRVPAPDASAPARLWIDRSFRLNGTGTVVTGTLASGTLLAGRPVWASGRRLRVHALTTRGQGTGIVQAPARVALALTHVGPRDIPPGTLLTAAPAEPATRVDCDVVTGDMRTWPTNTLVTVGTLTVGARLACREDGVRVLLPHGLGLVGGDRVVVRDPGGRTVLGGLRVRASSLPVLAPGPEEGAEPESITLLLAHLARNPLDAPPEPLLDVWGVTAAQLRDLGDAGRVLHLGGSLVLGSDAVTIATRVLARLGGAFTSGQAREALGMSRRTIGPLLEHLDHQKVTALRLGDVRVLLA